MKRFITVFVLFLTLNSFAQLVKPDSSYNDISFKGRIIKKPLFLKTGCGAIIKCKIVRYKIIECNIDSLKGEKVDVCIQCARYFNKSQYLRYIRKYNIKATIGQDCIIIPRWSKYQNKNR